MSKTVDYRGNAVHLLIVNAFLSTLCAIIGHFAIFEG